MSAPATANADRLRARGLHAVTPACRRVLRPAASPARPCCPCDGGSPTRAAARGRPVLHRCWCRTLSTIRRSSRQGRPGSPRSAVDEDRTRPHRSATVRRTGRSPAVRDHPQRCRNVHRDGTGRTHDEGPDRRSRPARHPGGQGTPRTPRLPQPANVKYRLTASRPGRAHGPVGSVRYQRGRFVCPPRLGASWDGSWSGDRRRSPVCLSDHRVSARGQRRACLLGPSVARGSVARCRGDRPAS